MGFVIRGDSGCNLTPAPSPGPWVPEGGTVIQLGQIKGRDSRSMKPMQGQRMDALAVWTEWTEESLQEVKHQAGTTPGACHQAPS